MKSKTFKRLLTFGLSVAVMASMNLGASAITYDVPTSPMTVDDSLITCAAHAQADATPEILGLTNTTDRAMEVPNDYSLSKAQSSVLIGTFGTDINSNPNPYLYNWAYNSWASENGGTLTDKHTLGGISGHPNSVDAEIVEDLGTSRSLYYRPDILVGTAMTGGNTQSYQDLVAALPENTDEDTTNDYDPYIVNYAMTSCTDFLATLYDIANDCEAIMKADSSRTMRYGDPVDIANQLTEYTVGIQSYILKQLAANNAEKKTVAIFDPINSADNVFFCVDAGTSTQGTTTRSRVGEFLDQTTENVVHKLGKEATSKQINNADKYFYALSAEEIVANADIIVTGGVNNGGNRSEAAIREMLLEYIDPANTELVNKLETMPVMSSSFSTVGSIGANSIENLLGMAYWPAFCYPEYINPVYAATYWYYNFYHVTDNNKLATIIDSTMSSASKPDGVTTDISGYSETQFQGLIDEGMNYYNTSKSTISNDILDGMAALLQKKSSGGSGSGGSSGGHSGGSGGSSTPATYDISVADTENGTVTSSAAKAAKDTTVTLTVAPAEGYETDKVTVTDSGNKEIELKDEGDGKYSFTMPRGKVSVTASFKQVTQYAVSVGTVVNGTVTGSAEKAAEGTDITLTVTPASGYEIDTVSVADADGKAVALKSEKEGTYSFTMPAADVTVTAAFRQIPVQQPSLSGKFRDLDQNAWYMNAVDFVLAENLFNGMSDTEFAPDATMTRAMFVTVLSRMEGIDASQYAGSSFRDVEAGQWYSAAVQWASTNDIVKGINDTTFNPDGDVTREQMATIMYRYANYKKMDTSGADTSKFDRFTDRNRVSDWAVDAMKWATAAGVINGMGDGTVAPQNTATRAQVAQIAMNFSKAAA